MVYFLQEIYCRNRCNTWSTFHLSGVAKLKELVLASENMMPKSTGFESSLDIAPI